MGDSTDVAVIGGGVAGLATARELARRGLRVTLIERGLPGREASDAAAGMLAPQAEADARDDFFDLLCASRDMYPSFVEALREESGVDVELDQTGTLYLALTEEDEAEIEHRYEWQSRAGLAVERLTAENARSLEPSVSPHVRFALRFPGDWQVENRRLVRALVESVERYGVRVRVEAAMRVSVRRGSVAGVETSAGGFLAAGAVVIATGAWASRLPLVRADADDDENSSTTRAQFFEHPKITPVRGQMLCFEQNTFLMSALRHVIYSPRSYVVPRRDGRVLAGSTTEEAGFQTRVTLEGVRSIIEHAMEIAPAVGEFELKDSWAGLRPRADDALPILGAHAEVAGLFYATGHYRNGILLAPVTGELLADLIVERKLSPQVSSFTPARFASQALASTL